MKPLRYYDVCSGIGGFHTGLDRAGGFLCVGHCEIDKHAEAAYRRLHPINESEVFHNDAKTLNTDTIPDFDLLTAGFPCQSFSVAGKRRGFDDPRGSLFFEIVRILKAKKPAYFLLENVPGLLSLNNGREFAEILNTLCELGYSCEWSVCNAKNHGVAQSRRRVFIIGFLDSRCAGQILPLPGTNNETAV